MIYLIVSSLKLDKEIDGVLAGFDTSAFCIYIC